VKFEASFRKMGKLDFRNEKNYFQKLFLELSSIILGKKKIKERNKKTFICLVEKEGRKNEKEISNSLKSFFALIM